MAAVPDNGCPGLWVSNSQGGRRSADQRAGQTGGTAAHPSSRTADSRSGDRPSAFVALRGDPTLRATAGVNRPAPRRWRARCGCGNGRGARRAVRQVGAPARRGRQRPGRGQTPQTLVEMLGAPTTSTSRSRSSARRASRRGSAAFDLDRGVVALGAPAHQLGAQLAERPGRFRTRTARAIAAAQGGLRQRLPATSDLRGAPRMRMVDRRNENPPFGLKGARPFPRSARRVGQRIAFPLANC